MVINIMREFLSTIDSGLHIRRATIRAHMVIAVGHTETQTQAKVKVTARYNGVQNHARLAYKP